MHEYYDYCQRPTRENASEFITQALENNIDIIAKKKNYMDYLANRPGVERIGTHGLFSNEGESVSLSKVAEEVANHKGVVWTNVISLRREDAARLGYDSAAQWQALLRSRVQLFSENFKIDIRNLKWYAAFHNESHHPHVHLVIYSTDPTEGFLSRQGIETMRSAFVHDIFRQEFMSIYERKTQQRDQIKEQANKSLLSLLQQMQQGVCHNERIAEQMKVLSRRLMNTKGKKVYGYLKADVKAIVNGIVDELEKEEKVAECYKKWLESQNEILRYYKDTMPEKVPLSEQKELKSIKNMIIQEAVRFGEGHLYFEDEEMEQEQERELTEEQTELAEQKNPFALYKLGKRYLTGEGVAKDVRLAIRYLEEAAENEDQTIEDQTIEDQTIENQSIEGLLIESQLIGNQQTERQQVGNQPAGEGKQYAQYLLGKLYLMGKEVPEDREKAYKYFRMAAEQGNVYAAYFLEHWDDMLQPDLLLMATRLLRQLGRIIEEDIANKGKSGRAGIDRKLARKIRAKKTAQGHAEDERDHMIQTM